MRTVFRYEKAQRLEVVEEIAERYPKISLAKAVTFYSLAAAVVVLVGIRLPVTAEHLAEAMGWHRSFVGTVFVALATSLPEAAVTLSALRIGALDMAISDLLGSNLFDLVIIAVDDLAYLKGPLLSNVSSRAPGYDPVGHYDDRHRHRRSAVSSANALVQDGGLGQPVHVRHLHPQYVRAVSAARVIDRLPRTFNWYLQTTMTLRDSPQGSKICSPVL